MKKFILMYFCKKFIKLKIMIRRNNDKIIVTNESYNIVIINNKDWLLFIDRNILLDYA